MKVCDSQNDIYAKSLLAYNSPNCPKIINLSVYSSEIQ